MKLDGYVRVSRVAGREGDSFISPDVQRQTIERWAQLREVEILVWHEDLDQSGGKLERPALEEALVRVEQGLSDGIVVARWDRFARSLIGALEAIKRMEDAGGALASVAEGIDPTTPAGKFQRGIFLLLAEFELERITESWAVAQERAIARGVHFQEPFGYRRPEAGGCLEPDPDEAPKVREVFRRRGIGESWQQLADWLNQQGPSPTGGEWVGRTVRHVIANEVYLGIAYHGRFRKQGAHHPIVTAAEWDAAQGKPGLRPNKIHEALLSGIIRCAGCGYRLKSDRFGPSNKRTRIYRCRGRHGAGRCPAPATVTAELAEAHVVDLFLARYGHLQVTASKADTKLADARRTLAIVETELDAFAGDTRLRAALGHDRFVSQVEARAIQVEQARTALAEAQGATGLPIGILPHTWETLEPGDQRQLLRAGVGAVVLRRTGQAPIGDRVRILWPGELPDDLPGPGKSVGIRPIDWQETRGRVAGGE